MTSAAAQHWYPDDPREPRDHAENALAPVPVFPPDELSFDEALRALTEAAQSLLEADGAGLTVWDGDLSRGVLRAAAGWVADHVGDVLAQGSAGRDAARRGKPVIRAHPDVPSASPKLRAKLRAMASTVAVPLVAGDATRITFQVGWLEPQSQERLDRAVDVLRTLGGLTQIAQRAEVERLRTLHEARLEALFDCVGDGVRLDTPDGPLLNAAARRLLAGDAPDADLEALLADYSPRHLDGRPLEPDEYPARRARATGQPVEFRHWGPRADGTERVFAGTVAPITREGEYLGNVWNFRDVTDEHTQHVLTERFLEQLFDSLPVAVAVLDPMTGEIASVNPAFAALLGYEVDDVVGALPPYPWWADGPHEEALRPEGEGPATSEELFRRADGRPLPVEVTAITVREPSGAPAASVLLIGDLSERRRFEAQIVLSGKLAAIGELAAGVAHEINNPLFAILGLVEFLLKDAAPGTKARERLELIQQTGLEIKEVVRALLDFAREPSGEFEVVSLHDVLAASVDLIRRTSLKKAVELEESYAPEPLYASASAGQLKQVLLNLVTNGQQAMGDMGTIRIALERDGEWALVTVTDTGPGIPADVIGRIFDPFFTTKRDLGGTGLGLALSQGIAHAHGGQLTAGNPPEGGAQFTLRLPLVEATA